MSVASHMNIGKNPSKAGTGIRSESPVTPSSAELGDNKDRFEEQKRRRAASIAQIIPKPAMIDYILRKVNICD